MNRYFMLSGGLHVGALVLLMLVWGMSSQQPQATYMIDFFGSGQVVEAQSQARSAQVPAAPEPKKEEPVKQAVAQPEPKKEAAKPKPAPKKAYTAKEEITTRPQVKRNPVATAAPLAPPSVLAENAASGAGSDTAGALGGSEVVTDFTNFPYQWYIQQVKQSLWSEWEKRRPAGNVLNALVTFAIMRDGQIKRVKVVRSSGDDTFDFAASSAVINAGPFQPLPMLYEKDELTVTVDFRQEI